jgi:hypothetical protein
MNTKYKIGNLEVEAIQSKGNNFQEIHNIIENRSLFSSLSFEKDEWVIVSRQSVFVLSDEDFNNIAVKVKEPKFKVGDNVYICGVERIYKIVISSVSKKEMYDQYWYTGEDSYEYLENELFTLEEAIERLKQL